MEVGFAWIAKLELLNELLGMPNPKRIDYHWNLKAALDACDKDNDCYAVQDEKCQGVKFAKCTYSGYVPEIGFTHPDNPNDPWIKEGIECVHRKAKG